MDKRGFLTSILALGSAPAIVRAESLMKLVVPKQEIILPPDYTVEGYIDSFSHVAVVRKQGKILTYINGVPQTNLPICEFFKQIGERVIGRPNFTDILSVEHIDGLRISSIARNESDLLLSKEICFLL